MKKQKFLEKIVKFLSNQSDSKETNKLNAKLRVMEENKTFLNKINDLLQRLVKNEDTWDVDKAWNSVENKILQPQYTSQKKNFNEKRIWTPIYRFGLVTAAVLLIAVSSYVILQQFGIITESTQQLSDLKRVETKSGNIKKIVLSDGSTIILNASSSIEFQKDVSKKTRMVFLTGEAYFDVAHNSRIPFVVQTDKIFTTVLGTKFNVKAFPEESVITVSLVEGSVSVSKNEHGVEKGTVVLQPAQQLVYKQDENSTNVEGFDFGKTIGWKDKKLIFRKEPLSEVFVQLERSYGVKFVLANQSYGKKIITVNFQNETLETVCQVIKGLTKLEYTISKGKNGQKKVTFYKK